jgi:hypothetical protein
MSSKNLKSPCSIEYTSRRVIEHKLLDSIASGSHVAILASRQDLEDLIHACDERACKMGTHPSGVRSLDLAEGMRQLYREAFP